MRILTLPATSLWSCTSEVQSRSKIFQRDLRKYSSGILCYWQNYVRMCNLGVRLFGTLTSGASLKSARTCSSFKDDASMCAFGRTRTLNSFDRGCWHQIFDRFLLTMQRDYDDYDEEEEDYDSEVRRFFLWSQLFHLNLLFLNRRRNI